MKGRLQRLILSLYFLFIAIAISRLIIYASLLLPFLYFSVLYIYSFCLSCSHYQTLLSSFLLICTLLSIPIIILNLFTCPPQVLCSASYGPDCQLWHSSLGSGEDRQWHSARHPPLRSHRLPRSYYAHICSCRPLHLYAL